MSVSLQISMGEHRESNFQWPALYHKFFATSFVIALVSITHLALLYFLTSLFTMVIVKFQVLKQTEKQSDSCFVSDSPAGDVKREFRVINTAILLHVLIAHTSIMQHNDSMH